MFCEISRLAILFFDIFHCLVTEGEKKQEKNLLKTLGIAHSQDERRQR